MDVPISAGTFSFSIHMIQYRNVLRVQTRRAQLFRKVIAELRDSLLLPCLLVSSVYKPACSLSLHVVVSGRIGGLDNA